MLALDEVSEAIYFIHEGIVEVSYKQSDYALVQFEEGSYIGDISYIYKIFNQYTYRTKYSPDEKLLTIYSLKDKYLASIFNAYPKFERIMKIRALRRHHYIRKLKN
jgi:CRP-like cAMP-binding protein